MSKKRADRKLAGTIIGWTVAAALAVGGFICVRNFASRDLSLMLCIDGKTVCAVESRAAVNQALLKLDEKLAANGSIYSGDNPPTERKKLREPTNALICFSTAMPVITEGHT